MIEVIEDAIVCDLCGSIADLEKPFMQLRVVAPDVGTEKFRDICTPDCLEKNLKGLILQVSLSDIPAAVHKMKEGLKKKEGPKPYIEKEVGVYYDSDMKYSGPTTDSF